MNQASSSVSDQPFFEAAITNEQLGAAARAAKSWEITRRCAYLVVSKGSEELINNARKDPETALSIAEAINGLIAWQESDCDILKSAQARMLSVLTVLSTEGRE